MEKKGTLRQKRRPKGDPNPQKGPLGDPGPLKGTQLGTVLYGGCQMSRFQLHNENEENINFISHISFVGATIHKISALDWVLNQL